MKTLLKKKPNKSYLLRLKKDLLLLLSHLERLEPQKREYPYHSKERFGKDIASFVFLSGECD